MIKRDKKYRFLEIFPGAFVIFVFVFLAIFSFISPLVIIYFIIVYDFLWLFKIIYKEITLLVSYRKFKKTMKVDWFKKLQEEKSAEWQNVYHIVLLPTYKEPLEVIENSLEKLSSVKYDLNKMFVVLAGEAAEGEDFIKKADVIKEKFGNRFFRFEYTVHTLQEGEIQGKGSNCHSAGKHIKEVLDAEYPDISYKNIIISNLDIDTIVHEQYFAHISYLHLTIKNPERTSYQPVALFNNNFWEATSTNRLISRGTTFWLLSDFVRTDNLSTFSSHSMNFNALVDVGFWHNDVVSEDSRIGFQCINYYNGDYKIQPVYIPVSLDIVDDDSISKSILNQYKQQRRWAYGMENFPYLVTEWGKNKKMPFKTKFIYIFNQLEGGFSWAVAPLIMFVFGFLPLIVINATNFSQTIIVRNAPFILETIMKIGMLNMVINAIVSFTLIPKKKEKVSIFKYILLFAEWLMMPVITILLAAFPAIDAYMRLMLGKYMGFWVTPKNRK